jgi:hypothetical protein
MAARMHRYLLPGSISIILATEPMINLNLDLFDFGPYLFVICFIGI